MFRSVFPAVSQHLKPSGKKGKNLGYLQPGRAASRKALVCGSAAHNGSCGSRLQARSRTKGKPNYLLQEARNEEALARLDMNLWRTCGRGALGVRFMGENWGGNVRQSQFPARGHKSPSYTCHSPYLCQRQPVKTETLSCLNIPDLVLVQNRRLIPNHSIQSLLAKMVIYLTVYQTNFNNASNSLNFLGLS